MWCLSVYGWYVVDALEEIALTLGSKYWKFNADTCQIESVGVTQVPPKNAEQRIDCECKNGNNTDCHVTRMYNSLSLFEELSFECSSFDRRIDFIQYVFHAVDYMFFAKPRPDLLCGKVDWEVCFITQHCLFDVFNMVLLLILWLFHITYTTVRMML